MSLVGSLYKALSPSYFTYGSHSAFWMGFTPGVVGSSSPLLNPKAGKLFRMAFAPQAGSDLQGFVLHGSNLVHGFNNSGYRTFGTGAVDWFNTSSETGSVLTKDFDEFFFSGNTWSLSKQLEWIFSRLNSTPTNQPVFLFLNIGETHVPYWHVGADWPRFPSPCIPFGGNACSTTKSRYRQGACLKWVDHQLSTLLSSFMDGTILVCADHGDCWGEDGLWEHGISHPATLTVPLLMRVRGVPITTKSTELSRPSIRNALRRMF